MPLLVSILVEFRPRQDHLAAIDLRAQIHTGVQPEKTACALGHVP
jgi:hypothetical protein